MVKDSHRHKLVIRNFSYEKDYATIEKWWSDHDSHSPQPEHLTEEGFIIEVDGEPQAVYFMYPMGTSSICYLGFPTINTDCRGKQRDEVSKHLLTNVRLWAKMNGFSLVYISIAHQKFISRLKEFGFLEADKGNTHMFLEVL